MSSPPTRGRKHAEQTDLIVRVGEAQMELRDAEGAVDDLTEAVDNVEGALKRRPDTARV